MQPHHPTITSSWLCSWEFSTNQIWAYQLWKKAKLTCKLLFRKTFYKSTKCVYANEYTCAANLHGTHKISIPVTIQGFWPPVPHINIILASCLIKTKKKQSGDSVLIYHSLPLMTQATLYSAALQKESGPYIRPSVLYYQVVFYFIITVRDWLWLIGSVL